MININKDGLKCPCSLCSVLGDLNGGRVGCEHSAASGDSGYIASQQNSSSLQVLNFYLTMLAINTARRTSAVLRAAPLSTWSAVPAGPPDPILG